MSDLNKRLDGLSREKRVELYRLLKEKSSMERMPRIKAQVRNKSTFPLSFAQETLWFLEQLYPNTSSYNVAEAWQISGTFNVNALLQALNAMLVRHESLRTTFALKDDRPVQVIASQYISPLKCIDLIALSEAEKEQEQRRCLVEETQLPFDLSQNPLLRVSLIRKSSEDHVLLVTTHHILIDMWSIELFMKELLTFYTAFDEGRAPSLPPLPIQYADYACWQRDWLRGQILETELAYWQEQLAGAPIFLDLPTDRPRPVVQTFNGERQAFLLSALITEQLKVLGRQEGATLFMTLLAAFQLLLSRYSGQDDVLVGTPIANRLSKEVAAIIGFFLNTVIIRMNLAHSPSFRALLMQMRKVALEAYEHQNLPFEYLVQSLQPERTLSYSPLFQVMFVLKNSSYLDSFNLTFRSLEIENKTSKVDLILYMEECKEGLRCYFEYNTDLFEKQSIVRMVQHFQALLENILREPDAPLRNISLLTPVEQQELLKKSKLHYVTASTSICLHTIFETQVKQRPDAIAVVDEQMHLTYQDLDQRANQLARYLIGIGVGIEVRVGLCLESSWELIVGILGIVKAGGVYVPIDPSYPTQRIAFILVDAQITVIVMQEHLSGKILDEGRTIVCIDRDWQHIVLESSLPPICRQDAVTAAYLIYTSGSTGVPKGTLVSHASVTQLFASTHAKFHFDHRDVWTLFHSVAFDFAVWELWGALLYGGRLIIVPYWISRSPEAFCNLLVTEQVTVLNQTPSAFSMLLQAEEEKPFSPLQASLRLVIFGGEALDFPKLQPWFERHGDKMPQLVNMYGITETTVHVTSYQLTTQDAYAGSRSVIGQPIPSLYVYILDQALNLVPTGILGELYVGGSGLARGYLHRPDLTAERFVPNPFGTEEGERLYKTGDCVRYLANGDIEYLGRLDQQVKIRGFRIELAEIEGILKQHPQVQFAVVVQREDVPGHNNLVAYLNPYQGDNFSIQEVRKFLLNRLPEYMVPSAFVALETLPLTINRKVDRQRLPAPDALSFVRESNIEAPHNPIEEILVGIWMQVLHVTDVSIHNNFFELGGHSLLATQLISRIRTIFQVSVPLKQLFEAPTIVGLARNIEIALSLNTRQLERETPILELVPTLNKDRVPLSFAQERLWFLAQLEQGNHVYNITTALNIEGRLDITALQRTVSEIIYRHEVLRTSFRILDDTPKQFISPVSSISKKPILLIDLSMLKKTEREEEKEQLVHKERQYLFDIAQSPLIRFNLLYMEEEEHILIISVHHIVFDGWSMGLLFREMSLLYKAFSLNHPSPLSSLPIQYADYTLWQRHLLQGDVLEKQLAYWKHRLDGAPTLSALPTDRPRPLKQTFKGAAYIFEMPKAFVERLRMICKEEGVTLFMLLLAVFNVLLYRYTYQNDIIVGSPIANRNQSETEGLIGFFVNTLVLRTNLSNRASFRELLVQVRDIALAAYAHQDLPFERLVDELKIERSLNINPLFQVLFDFQNNPIANMELENLLVHPLADEIETAKFDLALSIEDNGYSLQGTLIYSTDLFEANTIYRMVTYFQNLLEAIVTDPGQSLSELKFLPRAELLQMLVEWNDTEIAYPSNKLLHELFEEQVKQTPDRVAVVFEDQYITYLELNQRANQLAFYFQTLGIGPEIVVGICMKRSLELVIGILGVLKANGVYVPIDPFSPKERRDFMIVDSNTSVLMTQQLLRESYFQGHQLPIICLDTDYDTFSKEKKENPTSRITGDNLVYILYTSGSTGHPKGVMISHRSICNHMLWMRDTCLLTEIDGVLQRTSISFDASVWEFYAPLITGARLIMAQPNDKGSSVHLISTIVEQNVTVIQLTPTMLQIFLEESELKLCRSLKRICCGGEALAIDLLQRLKTSLDVELFNLYGPTETSVEVSFWQYNQECNRQIAPLGRPISNTQLYILDSYLQPVPIGVAGELYISGIGLARGYLHQAELTAEKFIPNELSDKAGARLYKTGDIARYLLDGNIEFLGRIDHQVKFHGYRLELEEIEATLKRHSSVQDALVNVRMNEIGDKRLVAYVILHEGPMSTTDNLSLYLQTKLPDYMVPSSIVVLEEWPLTSNGKLNRQALPMPDWNSSMLADTYVAPCTPIENVLADIWAQLLGIEKVGIHDNFFDLGGHSLLATRFFARLRGIFPIDIPLRSIFDAPSIKQLAKLIEDNLIDKIESLSEEEIQFFMKF